MNIRGLLSGSALALVFVFLATVNAAPLPPSRSPAARSSAIPNRTLIVGIYESTPFCTKLPGGQWTGLSVELWEQLARDLNIRYEWREYQFQNLLRALSNNDIDVAIGPISVTADRELIMDFTHPYYISDLAIAVPAKGALYPWGQIAREFFTISWLKLLSILVAMMFISGYLVWIFERRVNHTQFGGGTRHGLSSAFWWAAVTMSTVGYGDKTPQTTGGRIIALGWMFISIITVALVTGSITSAVMANRAASNIRTPADLGRAHVAVLNGSTAEHYALLARIDYGLYPTVKDALHAVLNREVDACIANDAQLRYLSHQHFARKLDILPFTFEREDCSFALQEGSSYKETIDRALLAIIHSDHWREIRARYLGAQN